MGITAHWLFVALKIFFPWNTKWSFGRLRYKQNKHFHVHDTSGTNWATDRHYVPGRGRKPNNNKPPSSGAKPRSKQGPAPRNPLLLFRARRPRPGYWAIIPRIRVQPCSVLGGVLMTEKKYSFPLNTFHYTSFRSRVRAGRGAPGLCGEVFLLHSDGWKWTLPVRGLCWRKSGVLVFRFATCDSIDLYFFV